MAKQLYVVGNWKMYKTAREATDYIETLLPEVEGTEVNIYLSVPFTSIAPAAHYAKETPVVIGAQNMNDAREGAFTGEIAGLMLKEAGASFVLLGHSERRHLFGETDALIHRKVLRALQDDIRPILCIGETARERSGGRTEEVLQKQLMTALEDVPKESAGNLIVAYEPVWAIGAGKPATLAHIQEAHGLMRACLKEIFGAKKGAAVPLLYGGSVASENVAAIVALDDVDGVLVGGASLSAAVFAQIIQNMVASGAPKKKAARKPRKKKEKNE
jgi:triosephosphate isomerase